MSYEDFNREQLEEALAEFERLAFEHKEEAEKWEEKAKKARADLENYRKKQPERRAKWRMEAEEELAEKMIEVMDNLERAIASAERDSQLLQGVKMVADQLYEKLEELGLERIDAEGEEFDPSYHKAVETREDGEPDTVLEEKRKGYRFGEKVLREAEVVVGGDETSDEES